MTTKTEKPIGYIFNAAIKHHPNNEFAKQHLPDAAAAFNSGDYENAVRHVEKIQCRFNQPSAVWGMLISYINDISIQETGKAVTF